MKCKKFIEVMSDYIDGNLSGHIRLEFEIHASQCTTCAREFEEMNEMLISLSSLAEHKSPVRCWDTVQGRIEDQKTGKYSFWSKWCFRPVFAAPVAVAMLLLFVLLIWPSFVNEPTAQSPVSAPEYSRYISEHAHAQRQQVMSDPDVVFISAELENVSLSSGSER